MLSAINIVHTEIHTIVIKMVYVIHNYFIFIIYAVIHHTWCASPNIVGLTLTTVAPISSDNSETTVK